MFEDPSQFSEWLKSSGLSMGMGFLWETDKYVPWTTLEIMLLLK